MNQLVAYADCETTDLDERIGGLLEFTIAILDPSQGLKEIGRFNSGKIAVGKDKVVSFKALQTNGYKPEELGEGFPLEGVISDAASFLDTYRGAQVSGGKQLVLMAHNAAFDEKWLKENFKAAGFSYEYYFTHRKIDIQAFVNARNLLLGLESSSSALDKCCEEWGIDKPKGIHRSDSDVTAGSQLARVILSLVNWSDLNPSKQTAREEFNHLLNKLNGVVI